MNRLRKWAGRARDKVRHALRPGKPVARADRAKWETHAQEGEFRFHKTNQWRQTPAFMEQTRRLFEHFGFAADAMKGKTVIDLGAGSKLRTKYFEGAELIVIEPLAHRYMSEIAWSDLRDAEVYSVPAEQRVESCVGRADLVVSINVLDHCYAFDEALANVRSYLKPGGLAFLSYDKHLVADEMHPLHLDETTSLEHFAKAGLKVIRSAQGLGDAVGGSPTYGHGPYAISYWLKRDDAPVS